ncbi:MAG: response regulator [Aggregatilineales bacterium]
MLNNVNILLIEDSPELRHSIAAVLKMHHATVSLATDAQSGLMMSLENPPDVIITDLEMPQFDGAWLINNLKIHQQTAHIPIMAMSADILSLMSCPQGIIRLAKPFRVERFIQLIDEAIRPFADDQNACHA